MTTTSIESKEWLKLIVQLLTQKNVMVEVASDREEGDAHNGNEEEKVMTATKEEVFKVINNLQMNEASGPEKKIRMK